MAGHTARHSPTHTEMAVRRACLTLLDVHSALYGLGDCTRACTKAAACNLFFLLAFLCHRPCLRALVVSYVAAVRSNTPPKFAVLRRRRRDVSMAIDAWREVPGLPRDWMERESFAEELLRFFVATLVVLLTVALLLERRLSSSRKRSSSPATSAATHSTAAKKVDDFPNGPLVILWGSQTGTAEGFGETLAREARQRGFKARSIDLEDYEPDELAEEEAPVVFLMATHGERPRSTHSSIHLSPRPCTPKP